MSDSFPTPMVPPISRTEYELRSLLAAVRVRLAETIHAPDDEQDWVSEVLSAAPIEKCIRLATAWVNAQTDGLPAERFSGEELLLLEMVEALYAPHKTAPGTDALFANLLNDLHVAEAA